jgi:hypothetical protein
MLFLSSFFYLNDGDNNNNDHDVVVASLVTSEFINKRAMCHSPPSHTRIHVCLKRAVGYGTTNAATTATTKAADSDADSFNERFKFDSHSDLDLDLDAEEAAKKNSPGDLRRLGLPAVVAGSYIFIPVSH